MINPIPITLSDRNLWGAKSIARFLDCDPQYVRRTLLDDPACPVRKIGNRYFSRSDELELWSRYFQPDNPVKESQKKPLLINSKIRSDEYDSDHD